MNLEEKVEEGFLTRLGRKGRKIILPWIATSIFTLGCERDITGPEDKKSKQEVVVSKTRTDVQGKAYFIENETQEQVEVQVVDTNNNPLQKSNLDIAFEDGINVEALLLQDPTVDNYKNYKNLEDGDYTLEVLVQDEVKNKSEIKNKKFSIKSSVQEKSFNVFDYAILTEGSYWNYTNDYYEKIIDVGEYDGKKIAIIENPSSGEFLWISSSAVYVFGINVWHDSGYNLFFNPPAKMGDSKMEIGDSFNNSFYVYSDTDYSEKMGNGKYNLEYLRLETVTVPAGTFKDCLVTREYSEYNIEDYNISGYSYRWLAKGVGFVKAEDSKGTVYKLKSYSVK